MFACTPETNYKENVSEISNMYFAAVSLVHIKMSFFFLNSFLNWDVPVLSIKLCK